MKYEELYNYIIEAIYLDEKNSSPNSALKKTFKELTGIELNTGATVHHLFPETKLENILIIDAGNTQNSNTVHQILHYALRNDLSASDILDALCKTKIYAYVDGESKCFNLETALNYQEDIVKAPLLDNDLEDQDN